VQNSLCVQVLRSRILAALLHGTPAAGLSQTLQRGAKVLPTAASFDHLLTDCSGQLSLLPSVEQACIGESRALLTGAADWCVCMPHCRYNRRLQCHCESRQFMSAAFYPVGGVVCWHAVQYTNVIGCRKGLISIEYT